VKNEYVGCAVNSTRWNSLWVCRNEFQAMTSELGVGSGRVRGSALAFVLIPFEGKTMSLFKKIKALAVALLVSVLATAHTVHADLVSSADSAVSAAGGNVTTVGTTLVILAASVVGILLIIRLFRRGQPG